MADMIYLDNAATTRISDNVFEAMLPWLKDNYGNASSAYSLGRKSAAALHRARKECASCIGAENAEIVFTSGATESNNLAVRSAAYIGKENGRTHIVTSAIEHPSVLETVKALEKEGFSVTYLPVSGDGIVDIECAEKAITEKTALASVMYVNNEIGTIQPIEEISGICRKSGASLHVDAVQAAGFLPIDVNKLGIDYLSLSGHKLHSAKGVGLLYRRKGIGLIPMFYGGGQESGNRSGTENIAAVVGMAEALKYATGHINDKNRRLLPLQARLTEGLLTIDGAILNGSGTNRVSGNVNVSFCGIESESLVLELDMRGIAVSGGSACSSASGEASHVLKAIGASEERIKGVIRFSMSEYTTEAEITRTVTAVNESVERLKRLRRGY